MKARFSLRLLLLLLLLRLAAPLAAHAQAPTKVFVASYGSDANDGSRGSPKRNFQAAHTVVADGGQIVVLDTAGYGALTITKSLAITVPPGVNGFVTVTGGSSGITINAGASDSVSLRGLIIEGGGSPAGGFGIIANSVGALAVEDCTVRNFQEGIFARSSTAARVFVRRCTARNCGDGLAASCAGSASVSFIATGCQLEQNTNTGAIASPFGSGNVDLTLIGCVLSGNASGVGALGTSLVRLDGCRITGNNKGVNLFVISGSTSQILSRGNNTLENNAAGNTAASFTGSYSAK
jgi:hypothetical protein